jgi:nucleotide-binding universal stress UspA family protein
MMYSKILVPLDGTEASVAGLNEAIGIAKQQQGGTLRLLHVVVLPDPIFDYGNGTHTCRNDMIASMCQIGKRLLGKAESVVRAQGLMPECVMFESEARSAADLILDQARQWNASLIVLGSHARHDGLRVGRDTAEVLAKSEVPVLLVRAATVQTEKSEVEPCAVEAR